MKKELQLKLVKKYPNLLKDYGGDPRQTCLAFGIETEDGWFDIINKCFEKIQYFCDLCSKDNRKVYVTVNQIKEKYGSLRCYVTCYGTNELESDIIHNIIDYTEMLSTQTCEETGTYGSPCVKFGWYKTLCYEEARKQGYKACDDALETYWKEKDERKHSD